MKKEKQTINSLVFMIILTGIIIIMKILGY